MQYSPSRRTALVLCGTGAHGAYHAGVLRALQEAGVRIDLVAGHGVGAAGAMLSAIDGGGRLWEPAGIWRSAQSRSLYGWTPTLQLVWWAFLALVVFLLVPQVLMVVAPSTPLVRQISAAALVLVFVAAAAIGATVGVARSQRQTRRRAAGNPWRCDRIRRDVRP